MQHRIGSGRLRAQMAALCIGATAAPRLDRLFGLELTDPALAELVRPDWILRAYVAARAALAGGDADVAKRAVGAFVRLLKDEPVWSTRPEKALVALQSVIHEGPHQDIDDADVDVAEARRLAQREKMRNLDGVLAELGAALFGQLDAPALTDDTRLTPAQIRVWLSAHAAAPVAALDAARAVLERRDAALATAITLDGAGGNPFAYLWKLGIAGARPVGVDALAALDLGPDELVVLQEAFDHNVVDVICKHAWSLAPPPGAATVNSVRALVRWLTDLGGPTNGVDHYALSANADAGYAILDVLDDIAEHADDVLDDIAEHADDGLDDIAEHADDGLDDIAEHADDGPVDLRLAQLLGADDGAGADEPAAKRRRLLDDLDGDAAAEGRATAYVNAVVGALAIRATGGDASVAAPLRTLARQLRDRLGRYASFARNMTVAARLLDALALARPDARMDRIRGRVYVCLREAGWNAL